MTILAWFRRRARAVVSIAVVVLVVLSGITLLWYGVTFHSFAFWSVPSRISYCHRDYQTAGSRLTGAQFDEAHLSSIGRLVPVLGWPLSATLASPELRADGVPCAMVLYLREGPNLYVAYGLLGGP